MLLFRPYCCKTTFSLIIKDVQMKGNGIYPSFYGKPPQKWRGGENFSLHLCAEFTQNEADIAAKAKGFT
jgi:hypothetical protein